MSFSIRKATLAIWLSLFLPIFISPINASEITLDSEVGFDGTFHLGQPFPLSVVLVNSGWPVEGTLEVRVWKGGPAKGSSSYLVYYRKDLLLPAQTKKRVQFTVDPDLISRPLTVIFSSSRGRLSKEIDLRRYFSTSPLVLLLSGDPISPPVPLASASQSSLISRRSGELPHDPRALEGLSAVVLYEESLHDLSAAQLAALESWLSSGGRIVVLGSLHYAIYQEPSIARFLPVRVVGLKKLSSLSSLYKTYGKQISSRENVWAQDSTLVEGRVLLEEQGSPILAEMSRGRGKVFYLALDVGRPPLSRWEGLPLLFQDLLGRTSEKRPSSQASWDEAVFTQLLSNPSLISAYAPAGSLLAWLFFYFLLLGVLTQMWRRQRLPRPTLVLLVLSSVLLASIGGYLHLGGSGMPDGVLVSSTLLESLPDGYVEAQSNLALFSTLGRYYNLEIDRGWTELEPVLSRAGPSETMTLVVREEGNHTRFGFPLSEWEFKLFKARSISRFSLQTEVQTKGSKLFLKITNATPKDLTECWLVYSGRQLFMGAIPHGSTKLQEIPMDRAAFAEGYSNGSQPGFHEIHFDDVMRQLLFRYSFFPSDQGMARRDAGAALFFGWVEGAAPRAWVDDPRVLSREYALFRAVIPMDGEGDL